MSSRTITRLLATVAAAAMATFGTVAATSAPAQAESINASYVCYNTSQAGPYAGYADQAASIWNNYTNNLVMSKCGSNVMIYYTTGGGSYAQVYSLGNGYVVIDTQQASQYSPLRIMTHELGHILGLPDNYNGNCAILMSGGSAGTSCTNPYPSSAEAYRVTCNFGPCFAPAGGTVSGPAVYKDSWPTADKASTLK